MNKETVYVTGHMHPDTDSVASAIGYAFYKRTQGVRAIPCRLGKLSAETRYLLDRFGFEEPMLLDDARFRISEIEIDRADSVGPDVTIREAFRRMEKAGKKSIGVVGDDGRLLGMVTKNDIAYTALDNSDSNAALLVQTPSGHFADVVDGTLVYDDPQRKINGLVSVIAIRAGYLDQLLVEERIILIGNDPEAQKAMINMGAGMLIIMGAQEVREDVIELAKENHVPIILSGHWTLNTSRNLFLAPPVRLIMTTKMITFYENELAEDVGRKMMRSRFRSYPVIAEDGKFVGLVSHYHIMNADTKKLILVDHNEFSQSVRAIEKATVLEVVDHHRINDFSTNHPVSFRNEIVGSSATIVATIFRENQIPLPAKLAGLLLGALLSDTLKFQSPTTTPRDVEVADWLAAIASLDIDDFARDMFSVSADITGKTAAELINQDIKLFDIDGCRAMIAQVIVTGADAIKDLIDDVNEELDDIVGKKKLDLCVVAFTSIIDNGSVFYAQGEKAEWAAEAFPNREGEQHSFQPGILSRKSQILPQLTAAIRKHL